MGIYLRIIGWTYKYKYYIILKHIIDVGMRELYAYVKKFVTSFFHRLRSSSEI